MSGPRTVAVIGGGVIGLCTAYSLRRRGADVVLLEAGETGSGASHGNAGWIVPSLSGPVPAPGLTAYTLRSLGRADSPVYLKPRVDPSLVPWMWRFWRSCTTERHLAGLHATAELGRQTMALYDELAADGVDFRMWNDGMLFAFLERKKAQDELEYLRVLEPYGYRIPDSILTGSAIRDAEPLLSDAVAGALVIQEERHVDPGSLMAGLTKKLREMDVDVREHTPVQSVDVAGGRLRGVVTPGGRVEADAYVVAAGAWSTPLLRRLGVRLPMQAGKGYSFSVHPAQQPRRPVYLGEAKVGVSPLGDRVRFAGTMELSGINLQINQRRVDAIVTGAKRYFATWPDEPLSDVWAGMRPVTADGMPAIGSVPGLDNVTASTGHSMLGVTLGPASGEAVADLVLTGRAPAVLAPFALTRFR